MDRFWIDNRLSTDMEKLFLASISLPSRRPLEHLGKIAFRGSLSPILVDFTDQWVGVMPNCSFKCYELMTHRLRVSGLVCANSTYRQSILACGWSELDG